VVTLGVAALAGELGVATHGAVNARAGIVTAISWLVFVLLNPSSNIQLTSFRTIEKLVYIYQVT
jgi:hypothetical protein